MSSRWMIPYLITCLLCLARSAPVKDAAGKTIQGGEVGNAETSPIRPPFPSLSSAEDSPFSSLFSAAPHPPLWQEHRHYLQQEGQQWYRPVPYSEADHFLSFQEAGEPSSSIFTIQHVQNHNEHRTPVDSSVSLELEPMRSWSSGGLGSLYEHNEEEGEGGETEEAGVSSGKAHGEEAGEHLHASTTTPTITCPSNIHANHPHSQAAYILLKKQLVEDAWIKAGLSFDMDPAELARRVRQLHVDGVPAKSVLHLSAWYIKREAPSPAYATAYLQAQSGITRRTTEMRRASRSEQNRTSRRAAQRRRREAAQGERFAKIIQDLTSGGIDFSLPVEKLEDETRGVSLGNECKAGSCTAAIRWYLQHHRSANDWRLFRTLRAKNRSKG